jgi:hypothetical protein
MTLPEKISALEGGHLEGAGLPQFSTEYFSGWGFVKLQSVARFWDSQESAGQTLEAAQEAFYSGLHAAQLPWGLLVLGEPTRVSIHFVLPGAGNRSASWSAAIRGAFPGCELAEDVSSQQICSQLDKMPFAVALTGNPFVGNVDENSKRVVRAEGGRLERILGTLRGRAFAYLVVARPVNLPEVDGTLTNLAIEEREIRSAFMRKGSSEDGNNPRAQHYLELLRVARENHLAGRNIGMWDVGVYLHTTNRNDLAESSRALHSVFTGSQNQPQPIRVNVCERPAQGRFEPTFTRLNSKEVTVLTCLPKEELPGYEIRQRVSFGVSPVSHGAGKVVDVGVVLKDGQRTGNWFSVPVNDWARHTLVAGVSGSGKTNTCKSILFQFWHDHSVPWLVLEPSIKSEYRTLLKSQIGSDVRVFTLGDETGVPFRLNPLEVMPGIHVQTHIDALLALFNSAFAWVSPMPEVLNLAIHRLYTSFGWDLATGINRDAAKSLAQPTLRDLLALIPGLVSELGYNDEISSTIRAGLLTRLSSLSLGAKGLMLNSGHSIPFDYLLAKPTILEMAAIGNEEEKAFLLGAVLVRLAQYRQRQGTTDGKLRHLLLIEEAHRLLSAVPSQVASEVANPRGKAVETFCHLLAELRAFGQGIVVAEQIPAKLAPDVVKNTTVKIVHRLGANDDRRLLGGTMNLDPSQEKFLSTLRNGQAVAYTEGRETAFHIGVPHFEHGQNPIPVLTKEDIVVHMRSQLPTIQIITDALPQKHTTATADNIPSCAGCLPSSCTMRGVVLQKLAKSGWKAEFEGSIARGWQGVWEFGMSAAKTLPVTNKPNCAYCVLMNIAALNRWDDETVERMRRNLAVLRDTSTNS